MSRFCEGVFVRFLLSSSEGPCPSVCSDLRVRHDTGTLIHDVFKRKDRSEAKVALVGLKVDGFFYKHMVTI